eukprot:354813_1
MSGPTTTTSNHNNSNTTSPNKRARVNEPATIEELNAMALNYIYYIGADSKLKKDKIRKIVKDLAGDPLWRRLDVFFRQHLSKLDDSSDKDEDNIVSDEDIINLMQRNGAKNFKDWFLIIRANAHAIAQQYAAQDQFYDQSHEDSRNAHRDRKSKRRNRNKNNMNIEQLSVESDSDSENEFLLNMIDQTTDNQVPDDVWQRIRRKQQLRVQRKQFKTSQEDFISLIIARAYNTAGLDQPLMLMYLKAFCRDVTFKISDLKSASQLDFYNTELIIFTLRRYFEFFREECKNTEEKEAFKIIENACYSLLITKYILEITVHFINY